MSPVTPRCPAVLKDINPYLTLSHCFPLENYTYEFWGKEESERALCGSCSLRCESSALCRLDNRWTMGKILIWRICRPGERELLEEAYSKMWGQTVGRAGRAGKKVLQLACENCWDGSGTKLDFNRQLNEINLWLLRRFLSLARL